MQILQYVAHDLTSREAVRFFFRRRRQLEKIHYLARQIGQTTEIGCATTASKRTAPQLMRKGVLIQRLIAAARKRLEKSMPFPTSADVPFDSKILTHGMG